MAVDPDIRSRVFLLHSRSLEVPTLSPGRIFHPESFFDSPGARRGPPGAENCPKLAVPDFHDASMSGPFPRPPPAEERAERTRRAWPEVPPEESLPHGAILGLFCVDRSPPRGPSRAAVGGGLSISPGTLASQSRKKSTISVFRRFRLPGAVSGPRGLQKRAQDEKPRRMDPGRGSGTNFERILMFRPPHPSRIEDLGVWTFFAVFGPLGGFSSPPLLASKCGSRRTPAEIRGRLLMGGAGVSERGRGIGMVGEPSSVPCARRSLLAALPRAGQKLGLGQKVATAQTLIWNSHSSLLP